MTRSWETVGDWNAPRRPEANASEYAAGFVLAGGKSSRMGADKAQLKLDGESLVGRAVRKLRYVCAEVAIAGGGAALNHYGRVIPDLWPGCGPLGGIVSALEQTPYEWNLFLAVDMPFVPEQVLRTLIVNAGGSAQVVVAEADDRLQPLCAVYSKASLPTLRTALESGRYKLKDAIEASGAWTRVPFPEKDWFRNLNTPEEFQAVCDPPL